MAADWSIVIVALASDSLLITSTIERVERYSVSDNIKIVAADTLALRRVCDGFKHPTCFNLPDQYPDDCYWQMILGSGAYQEYKTIFIRAGTLVTSCWDARLAAAIDESGAAAISPVSTQHELLTLFDSAHKPELPVDDLDQWLIEYAKGENFDIPFVLESCALLQGPFWGNVDVDTDGQLFQITYEQGIILLGTDQLLVDDSAVSGINNFQPLPAAWVEALKESHPLTVARHAFSELDARKEQHILTTTFLPAKLHIAHSWGGGLGRWVEDAVEADSQCRAFVLRSLGDWGAFGKRIALYDNAKMGEPLKSWLLAKPILSTTSHHYQYQQIIHEVVSDYGIEEIVVSSLIGQSLDVLRTTLPTTIVCHDFYPFCPALVATFDKPCRHCDSRQLKACLSNNPSHRFFKMESESHWSNIRSQFLNLVKPSNIHFVAPSQSVINRYKMLAPSLKEKGFKLIEHGLSSALLKQLEHEPKTVTRLNPERIRIVILGSLVAEKGGELFGEILAQLTRFADIYLVGSGLSGRKYAKSDGVTFIERYDQGELGSTLQNIQPEMALLLSIVPETFSYTLSELWAAGIPVVATKVGAFSDRVKEGVNGWLVEPDPHEILAKLELIIEDKAGLERTRSSLLELPLRSAKEMMKDYGKLRGTVALIPKERFLIPYSRPLSRSVRKGQESRLYTEGSQDAYKKVLSDFILYTGNKFYSSPRTPRLLRAVFLKVSRFISNRLA